ncbi:MAG: class I SAM-dependent methyltransferase [Acidobacteria bacterium]|nr:class I SAM-dependent methyltransferase [Acidobacteriota bacterium]
MRKPIASSARLVPQKWATRAMAIVEQLLADHHPRDFAVELWDGSRLEPDSGQFCRFTWHIRQASALRSLLRPDRQVALGEAYIHEEFDISGDILAIFTLAAHLADKDLSATEKLRLRSSFFRLPSQPRRKDKGAKLRGRVHSISRDQEAVSFHYDVSEEFYHLWLDPALVYSCAYFQSREDSLEQAQAQKLDYICRKLRLQPGERLLDIGCGWGELARHAARHYGVHATGITVSREQVALARKKIAQAGLSQSCQVELLDYRDALQLGCFDKLVSVGMVEHVGEEKLPEYFQVAFGLLKPGGVFLNHAIARAGNRGKTAEPTFTDIYVFPDGELVPISTMLTSAERAGFEVRDVENLREHYFLTLCHWLRRLEARHDEARNIAGELKYRIWRLYLAGSAFYFQSGKLQLYQSLLVKARYGQSGMPLRRDDWYDDASATTS